MSGLDEKGLIEPCGGCGEADPAKRCLNCHHEFFPNRRASAPPALGGLVERLQHGIRHLSKTATADEYREFRALGDSIAVNEGDFWNAIGTMPEAAATLSAQEAEIERLRAQAERIRELEEALTKRIEWHRCSCPEPCDDYWVFPGGCIGKYREDYRKLRAILRAKEQETR